jgi:hypothetical protein
MINKVLIFINENYSFQKKFFILEINSNSINNVIDIDQRLKSLEKFIKQNFPH